MLFMCTDFGGKSFPIILQNDNKSAVQIDVAINVATLNKDSVC